MNTRPLRQNGRRADQLRDIRITRRYTRHAEGSVLIEYGHTRVICTATVEMRVPDFLRETGQGWITAEYGMLPRATHSRTSREAVQGKQTGRTQEIQRLIGRAMRAAFDLTKLGAQTIRIDCDVIQADGGTRTASISGAFVAVHDALTTRLADGYISTLPLTGFVAAVSVGIVDGMPVLDLDYEEDTRCDTDMNIVMNHTGHLIEIQGTAEGAPFSRQEMDRMLALSQSGIDRIIAIQKAALAQPLS